MGEMPGCGKLSAKRRPGGRATVQELESGRSVSEEVTVLVNTLRSSPRHRGGRRRTHSRLGRGSACLRRQGEAKKAEEAILAIMTACGFHDLVGQRVTKIAESLDRVIATKRAAGGGQPA
jgi:hypothetical protein